MINFRIKEPVVGQRQAKARKLNSLNNKILGTLIEVETEGVLSVREAYHWNDDEDEELSVEVRGSRNLIVVLNSSKLITDEKPRHLVERCLMGSEMATGSDYETLGDYLSTGKYVRSCSYSALDSYSLAIGLGQQSAIVKSFQLMVKGADWDSIYRKYKWAVLKGMTESEFQTSSDEVRHAVAVESLAEKGNVASLRELASYYQDKKRTDRYRDYMRQLANLGEKDAIIFMSQLVFEKSGNLSKKEQGMEWHAKAAENGCTEAYYRLGRICELLAKTDESRTEEAIRYHEEAARAGITESMYRLYRLYGQKSSRFFNQRKSAYYLAKAYEFGHQLAMRHFPDAMV